PAIAAYYMEQAAIVSPSEKNWNEAGNRYYAATRFAKETEQHLLFEKAMECFEKVLELNSGNTEAKINLGACYVEGSAEPMKGITMLKEVEKTENTLYKKGNNQLNFDVSKLPNGFYLMKAVCKEGLVSKRIVVQR
ncbi:MAG: T9SS type A sorting domain-containing protein, partial [Bacteroidia bacterium]|nr:T9SS type A sorting domain-containing protein [Bacteroidia bacterium]